MHSIVLCIITKYALKIRCLSSLNIVPAVRNLRMHQQAQQRTLSPHFLHLHSTPKNITRKPVSTDPYALFMPYESKKIVSITRLNKSAFITDHLYLAAWVPSFSLHSSTDHLQAGKFLSGAFVAASLESASLASSFLGDVQHGSP